MSRASAWARLEKAEIEKARPDRPTFAGDLKDHAACEPIDQLAGIAAVVAGKISVTGTFNPAALFGLGGGAEERTAQNTELIAKHTKRLADAAVTGGLTFA